MRTAVLPLRTRDDDPRDRPNEAREEGDESVDYMIRCRSYGQDKGLASWAPLLSFLFSHAYTYGL